MLIKIHQINNVRNLNEFNSSDEFLKRNVIFALNGSGKTNLSRFFKKFEIENLSISQFEDLLSLEAQEKEENIEFNLEFTDHHKVTDLNPELPLKQNILVYNKEFLDENITINDFSKKNHTGEINIGKIKNSDDSIKSIESEINSTNKKGTEIKDKIESDLDLLSVNLRKKYNAKKSTFSDFLNFTNLNNTKLLSEIKKNESIKESEINYSKITDINENDVVKTSFSLFNELKTDNISSLLLTAFDFKNLDTKIENHIKLISKDWVTKGIEIYESDYSNDNCPFCRQTLEKTDIIDQYNLFIDSLKSKTIDAIEVHINDIKSILQVLELNKKKLKTLPNEIERLNKIIGIKKPSFIKDINSSRLDKLLNIIAKYLEIKKGKLTEALELKEDNLSIVLSEIKSEFNRIQNLYSKNNLEIQSLNLKISDLSKRKSELRKQIAQLALLNFNQQNITVLGQRNKFLDKLEQDKKRLKTEKDKAPSKEKKEVIIQFMNELIKTAGLYKYEINKDFNLLLKTNGQKVFDISKHTNFISEGEKSVIAFTYFIASSIQKIERFEDINDLTLFIDDPVSSNSYNYLHGMGRILKTLPTLYRKILDNTNTSINPQIFVLTHNLQFYNFLAGNVYKKNSVFYNFEINHTSKTPFLKKVNNSRKLSEYLTSLKRVYEFSKEMRDENIGGDIRKVLETICSFHFLELKPENIELIFGKEPELDLKLIADDYTHTDFNNYEDPLTLESLKKASICLLKFIEEKYNSQYLEVEKMCEN
jgi:hypothetical protein